MRYRKRIKIAPGIKINLSGSGVSATVGPRGANVNLGKKGTYLNTGIPGTGLYDRTKISGSSNRRVSNQRSSLNGPEKVNVKLDLDENYLPVITVHDSTGNNISTPSLINKVKRGPEYKENLKEIYRRYHRDIEEETKSFTDLYKKTLPPVTPEEIQNKITGIKPKEYVPKRFAVEKPSEESIEKVLKEEAVSRFDSIWFWKNKKNRRLYIFENLKPTLEKSLREWNARKKAHEVNSRAKAEEFKAEQEKQIKEEKEFLRHNLEGKEYIVLENFQNNLNDVKIEPEFFIDFTYNEDERVFLIDLDLPEIEHLPKEKSSLLKSGKISVKNKSEKQLREEYAICVTGLAFLIGGVAFMSAAGIEKVKISGYTQRLDRSMGITKDNYIYTIVFDRSKFQQINYQDINPIHAFENFEHEIELSKTFVFSTIEEQKPTP